MDYDQEKEGCASCETLRAESWTTKDCLRCGQQSLFCSDCDGEICDYCQHMASKDD